LEGGFDRTVALYKTQHRELCALDTELGNASLGIRHYQARQLPSLVCGALRKNDLPVLDTTDDPIVKWKDASLEDRCATVPACIRNQAARKRTDQPEHVQGTL
jgi:hypothetical protein